MNLRDPAKMASNARVSAKMLLKALEQREATHKEPDVQFTQETKWRPEGKEWNPLDHYLRETVRICNLKAQVKDNFKEKTDLAATLTGLEINYKISSKMGLDENGNIALIVFHDDAPAAKGKIIHKLSIYN